MRYAATASYFDDRPDGAYALLFMGSVFVGVAQCWFQIVPPAYSLVRFDVRPLPAADSSPDHPTTPVWLPSLPFSPTYRRAE